MAIRINENAAKPFLRWAGGKAWFSNQLDTLITGRDFTDYHEPFLGGGSVFFSLSVEGGQAYLSDANAELINTYIAVRDNPERVIEYIRRYRNTEKFYYSLRSRTPRDFYEKAAKFIYLNHTCFNGLYRVNKEGKFNVPYGRRRSVGLDYDVIRNASIALQNTILTTQDFDQTIEFITPGSLVFLDPPYTVSHNNNGFVEYNKNIFSLQDQERLAQFIQNINDKGAFYILTNAAHDTIREIFRDCGHSYEVERQSLIGGKNARRGLTSELVFTNIER